MPSRKKKEKREKKKLAQQKRGMRLPPALSNAKVIATPTGAAKMSDVLWKFLEPYSHTWSTEDELRRLLTVGMIAWNAAVVSGKDRSDLIEKMLALIPHEVRAQGRAIIEELIQRKEAHFASNRRMMVDYQLTWSPTDPHLSVMSTLDMPATNRSTGESPRDRPSDP